MDVYVFLFTDLLLITKAKKGGDRFKVIKPVSLNMWQNYLIPSSWLLRYYLQLDQAMTSRNTTALKLMTGEEYVFYSFCGLMIYLLVTCTFINGVYVFVASASRQAFSKCFKRSRYFNVWIYSFDRWFDETFESILSHWPK